MTKPINFYWLDSFGYHQSDGKYPNLLLYSPLDGDLGEKLVIDTTELVGPLVLVYSVVYVAICAHNHTFGYKFSVYNQCMNWYYTVHLKVFMSIPRGKLMFYADSFIDWQLTFSKLCCVDIIDSLLERDTWSPAVDVLPGDFTSLPGVFFSSVWKRWLGKFLLCCFTVILRGFNLMSYLISLICLFL